MDLKFHGEAGQVTMRVRAALGEKVMIVAIEQGRHTQGLLLLVRREMGFRAVLVE